jgi:hypothetical protein
VSKPCELHDRRWRPLSRIGSDATVLQTSAAGLLARKALADLYDLVPVPTAGEMSRASFVRLSRA